MITFLLGNKEHSAVAVDLNTTVLDYLREHLQRIGTKEGCASVDCGACTIVLGEVMPGAALEIGSAVTYSDCQQLLMEQYPYLRELFERLGSLQIRNQGG